MKTSLFASAALLAGIMSTASHSLAATEREYVQCWAEGNSFRVNGNAITNNLASTRLYLIIDSDGDSRKIAKIIGHVSGQKFVDGAPAITAADFYSQVNATDISSSLSPRARVYKDADFWRFNDIVDSDSSHQDGGNLSATLVISKSYEDNSVRRNGDTVKGHLIFQHGDHTGGTMDLTCAP